MSPAEHRPSVGLVVQGGAMRTVYAAGALSQLERLGLRTQILAGCGSSAGAIALTCFLIGKAISAEEHFLELLPSKRFIDRRRLRRIVDVDYLIDDVVATQIAPNMVRDLPTAPPCVVAVTLAATGQPIGIPLNGAQCTDPPTEVLRASAAIPVLYGRQINLSVGACIDGGISDPLPIVRLLEMQPDIVLAITTRPPGQLAQLSRVERFAIRCHPGVPRSARRLLVAPNPLSLLTEEIVSRERWAGARIICVSPSDPARLVARTSLDRPSLRLSAQMGAHDVELALSEAGLL